jgi:hypothetical protein
VAVVLPILAYRFLDLENSNSIYFFRFLLIPAAQLVVEGSAIVAVAIAYTNEKPDWKDCLRQARGAFVWLWLIQLFKSLGGVLLAPFGVFTFSSQILLLEKRSVVGCLKGSLSMVFSSACSNFGSVLFLGCIVCPVLGNFMNIGCAFLVGKPSDDMKAYRQQVQQLLLQSLLTSIWTVFYLDIRIRKGLKREQLQRDLSIRTVGSRTRASKPSS